MLFKKQLFCLIILFFCTLSAEDKRPNIVFALADDWSWPHAGAYGKELGIKTPVFDSIAKKGVLFSHAFVSSPSCTPSRGAILSGQDYWRLKEGANLWGTLSKDIPLYTDILSNSGYHVGFTRKGWGPGNYKAGGRETHPAGKKFDSFTDFLKQRKEQQPFCFWFGSNDPHRPYELDLGSQKGIDSGKVHLFKSLPDHPTVRKDVADYMYEVARFDREVGRILEILKEVGELDNTIIVMTGDHGMPFPRCKGNLYDSGTRVPLVISWGSKIKAGRLVNDFINLIDLAPTFLEVAGLKVPEQMTGKSLLNILKSEKEGRVEEERAYTVFGRERHTLSQKFPSQEGYPCRALRTDNYLFIKNFKPDLWPAGVPTGSTRGINFSDCDYGPTKQFILQNRNDANIQKFYDLAFAKRPKHELYDLKKDPEQLNNLANNEGYDEIRRELSDKLNKVLLNSDDPRIMQDECDFKKFKFYGRKRKFEK
ncbi:MAG: sulfatase [Lentisphaeraceae bacterium]|nr:sulfatase [Lentisphaeraceae bacterium]